MTKEEEAIDYWKSKFRILEDWEIVYAPNSEYKSQLTRNTLTKKATIYAFGKDKIPIDYIFHEILHICLAEVFDSKPYKIRREKEEKFIQDLCKIKNAMSRI